MAKPYNFADLSAEAKEKVVKRKFDDTVQALIEPDWYEMTIDEFKEEFEKKYGIEVDDVQFSGFYSQGDGASFTFFKCYPNLMNEEINKKGNILLAGAPDNEKTRAIIEYIKRESNETHGGYMISAECTRSNFHYAHERSVTPSVTLEVYSFDDIYESIRKYVIANPDDYQGRFKDHYVDVIVIDPMSSGNYNYSNYDTEYKLYIGFDENRNGDYEKFQEVTVSVNTLNKLFDESTGILKYTDILPNVDDIDNILMELEEMSRIVGAIVDVVGPEKFIEAVTGSMPDGITPYEMYERMTGYGYISQEDVESICEIMESNLEQLVISESKDLYKRLESEYEAMTDESQVSDFLEANDTDQYDENGEPYVDRDSTYTYSELGRVAQTKLKNQFYDNYNFEDFNDALIQEKIAKIRDLGFIGVKFEIATPDTCKITYTDIDYNKTKEWMLAGYKGTSVYDELMNMEMRQLPDGVKQQAEDVKLQLLDELEEKMSAWVAATYDSDTSDEMIEEYYGDDRFFEDGTLYEDPDDDE